MLVEHFHLDARGPQVCHIAVVSELSMDCGVFSAQSICSLLVNEHIVLLRLLVHEEPFLGRDGSDSVGVSDLVLEDDVLGRLELLYFSGGDLRKVKLIWKLLHLKYNY